MNQLIEDFSETGLNPGDIALAEEEHGVGRVSGAMGIPQPLLLTSEDEPNGRTFPWRQVCAVMKRAIPEIPLPSKGERRDHLMKQFWRNHGKTVSAFELLAEKVRASDYLMARNGHTGNHGRPQSWGWIFGKTAKGELRAEKILADGYSNDAMAFVLEREAKVTLTKVMPCGGHTAVEVNLKEMWNGEPSSRPSPPPKPPAPSRGARPTASCSSSKQRQKASKP